MVRRARALGLRPYWAGRVRAWSWAELERLATPEAQRLEQADRERLALNRRAGR